MKVLTIDIETAPNIADVWDLWHTNVSLSQLRKSHEVLCFAAKWFDDSHIRFHSQWDKSHGYMVEAAWRLLNDADVVVHYNGRDFDIPHLNREFLEYDLTPPSPYQQVDLMRIAKKQFRFASNKLDHVAQELSIGKKVEHEGHELWVKVLAGDKDARRRMKEYNIHDVRLTETLYRRLLPWITNHPSPALYTDDTNDVCSSCGSSGLIKEGFVYTKVSKYQRYSCRDCGKWCRSGKRVSGVDVR